MTVKGWRDEMEVSDDFCVYFEDLVVLDLMKYFLSSLVVRE